MPAYQEFLGSIGITAFPWAISGHGLCDGTRVPISQNDALYAALRSALYGGDDQTWFSLPDLRGRMPVGTGQGAGLSLRTAGQVLGSETVTLTGATMPEHVHPVALGGSGTGPFAQAAAATGQGAGNPVTGAAGSGEPFSIMPPSLAVTFQIALEGVFPIPN